MFEPRLGKYTHKVELVAIAPNGMLARGAVGSLPVENHWSTRSGAETTAAQPRHDWTRPRS